MCHLRNGFAKLTSSRLNAGVSEPTSSKVKITSAHLISELLQQILTAKPSSMKGRYIFCARREILEQITG